LISDNSVFVRLELDFADSGSKLAFLPWEYLRNPGKSNSKAYFLAAHDQIAVTRKPPGNRNEFESTQKLKILLVASSPCELPALVFEQLIKDVSLLKKNGAEVQVLQTPFPKDGEPPLHTKPKAMFDAFKRRVKEFSPHVVHFLGHGRYEDNQGKIAFVNDQYRADWRSGNEVAEILKSVDSVVLAFLQACETATEDNRAPKTPWSDTYQALSSVAGMVVQISKVPAIVAMQDQVENIKANTFAQTFYRSLVEHQPIYRAIQIARAEARKAEEGKGIAEHFSCVPVLYLDTVGKNDEGIVFPDPNIVMTPLSSSNLPTSITCPWCTKVNAISRQAQEVPRKCAGCRNLFFCPECKQGINPVDPAADQAGCNYCDAIIHREKPREKGKPASQIDSGLQSGGGMRQFTASPNVPGSEPQPLRQSVFEPIQRSSSGMRDQGMTVSDAGTGNVRGAGGD
jgi:hypothetical protein